MAAVGSFGAGHAAATNWTNAAGGDWATPGNWDAGVPTAIGSDAIFNLGAASTYTVSLTSADVANNLSVDHDNVSLNFTSGQSLSLSGNLNIVNPDGTLTVSGGTTTVAGTLTCAGTFNESSGAVSVGALSISGIVNFSGGSLTASSISSTSSGQLNWTGGTLNVTGGVTIGAGGASFGSSGFHLQQIGLTDAVHTNSNGAYTNSLTTGLNSAGQIAGKANRYSGTGGWDTWLYSPATNTTQVIGITDPSKGINDFPFFLNAAGEVAGNDFSNDGLQEYSWFYSPATNTTTVIGFNDAAHQGSFGGNSQNVPLAMTSSGQVVGGALYGNGNDAWLYSPATNTTEAIGLHDSAHTPTGGLSNNVVVAQNDAGEVAGYATRYSGTTNVGQDIWLYSPLTNSARVIGLTDAAHTQTGGYRFNSSAVLSNAGPVVGTPAHLLGELNAAGQFVGFANRYSGSTSEGQDTWLYSPASNTTQVIGLTDAPHTQTGGYSFNTPVALNDSGQAVGTANRYSGSTTQGQDAWFYSPSTNTSQVIGIIDAAHTEADGSSVNKPFALNAAGDVAGTATRFNGAENAGQPDAWFYNPTTNTTQLIGLTDAGHTNAGFSNNTLVAMNAAGEVAGSAVRSAGGSGKGSDAWVYDPSNNQTFAITLSQSPTGTATSQIEYLGDNGVAVGFYDLYSGVSFVKDAFVWTEANGAIDLGSLTGSALLGGGWKNLVDALSVNGTGQIAGYGAFPNNDGQGTFSLSPNQGEIIRPGMQLNSGGSVSVAFGAVLDLAGGNITAPSVVVQPGGGFLWASGTLNITGTGSSFGSALTVPNGGLLKLDGSISDPVAVTAGGVFDLGANPGSGVLVRTLKTITILPNVGSGANGQVNVAAAENHANRQLIVTSGLTIAGSINAWQGQLDLANNDMILHNPNMETLTSDLYKAFNNGQWNGAGIASTSAAADTRHLTALGYRAGGISFDGVNTSTSDVLIKYTYYGDADLNGTVDGADYHQIDMGIGLHLTGWSNGDFNYDGVVDGSDYALIDNAFNQLKATGAGPLGLIATPAATGEVPEPGELSLVGVGFVALIARRRRNKAQ